MLKRCWIGVLVSLAAVALPAQGQVKMEWKFKEGDKFYLENTTVQKQTIEVLGQKIEQETENTTVTSFTVLKKEKDSTVIEQKIESVKVTSKGGLGGAMDKVAEQMKGATFKFTLDNKGQISKFEGFDEFIKKIAGDDAATAQIMKLVLNEDTVKQSASEAFGFLPEKAVSKGDKWKKEMIIPMGPLGSFKAEQDYTYLGEAKDGQEIGVASKMTYTAPKDNAGGVLPFKVTKGDFKTEEAKGTIVFDAAAGRLVREEMKMKLKGSMTIEAMGQTADMKMEQESTTKIRLLDKPPKD